MRAVVIDRDNDGQNGRFSVCSLLCRYLDGFSALPYADIINDVARLSINAIRNRADELSSKALQILWLGITMSRQNGVRMSLTIEFFYADSGGIAERVHQILSVGRLVSVVAPYLNTDTRRI